MNLPIPYCFRAADIYLPIAKVTNQSDAIVNTCDDYEHVAGILPNIDPTTRP